MSFPQRGETYWVRLDPTEGSEIAKTRPALVISNDIGNQYAPRVIVAPISSSGLNRIFPFEVEVRGSESGLAQDSKVLLDQIQTVDKRRLGSRIGSLSEAKRSEVDRAIRLRLSV